LAVKKNFENMVATYHPPLNAQGTFIFDAMYFVPNTHIQTIR